MERLRKTEQLEIFHLGIAYGEAEEHLRKAFAAIMQTRPVPYDLLQTIIHLAKETNNMKKEAIAETEKTQQMIDRNVGSNI